MDPIDIPLMISQINTVGLKNWLFKELTVAFRDARKNKTTTFNEHTFEEHWMENLNRLTIAILERYYAPSGSIAFVVFDPMVREIFAAPFVDRVVHHFLYNMQAGWWDRRFINDSYSCRKGKGTLYGVKRAREMMRRASSNFTRPAYVIKLDIKGYFMSLPRQKVYERICWGLERQFSPYFSSSVAFELYQICKFLWHQIIMDDPVHKAIWKCPKAYQRMVPPEKTMRAQPPGYGIVIGNTTSQLASNIYLDQVDRFITINLGYKYYGRYVDDNFIIVPEDQYEQAKRDVKIIERHIKDNFELTLHPKKRYYQSVYKGMQFLGTRIYPYCYYPSNRLQSKFERILSDLAAGKPIDKATLISYFGYMRHLDVNQYIVKTFAKYNLDPNLFFELEREGHRPSTQIIEELMRGF